jgi:hypothetical protein
VCDARLDGVFEVQVEDEAPDRAHEPGNAIVPIAEALRTRPNALFLQLSQDFRADLPEICRVGAWPLSTNQCIQFAFPIWVGLIGKRWDAPLATTQVGLA